jgi:hypothetical protein
MVEDRHSGGWLKKRVVLQLYSDDEFGKDTSCMYMLKLKNRGDLFICKEMKLNANAKAMCKEELKRQVWLADA